MSHYEATTWEAQDVLKSAALNKIENGIKDASTRIEHAELLTNLFLNENTISFTLEQVRDTLGLGNTTGAVPVSVGGTGGTTATTARANLGAMALNPAGIELMPSTGTSNGGYIDFHYGGDTSDYSSRIIESANGTISINNHLFVHSDHISVNSGFYLFNTQDATDIAFVNLTFTTRQELGIDWNDSQKGKEMSVYTTIFGRGVYDPASIEFSSIRARSFYSQEWMVSRRGYVFQSFYPTETVKTVLMYLDSVDGITFSDLTRENTYALEINSGGTGSKTTKTAKQNLKINNYYYDQQTIGTVNVNTGSYAVVKSNVTNAAFVTIDYWSSANNVFNVVYAGTTVYALAPNGTTINGLRIKIWYPEDTGNYHD